MVDRISGNDQEPRGIPRFAVPAHWAGSRDEEYQWGIGDMVLVAAILQGQVPQLTNQPLICHLPDGFRNDFMQHFEHMHKVLFYHYDPETNDPMKDPNRIFRPGYLPIAVLGYGNVLGSDFQYPTMNKKQLVKNPPYDHVYCFDAKTSKKLNSNNEQAWKNENPTAVDIGGKKHSLSNTIQMMMSCNKYVGAFNGMAHLALASGCKTTAYIPDNWKPDAQGKIKLRVFKKNGGIIRKESQMFGGGPVSGAIKLPENI